MYRRNFVFAALILTACFLWAATPGAAQTISTSPYDPLARAKSTWPPFYKPDPQDAMYTKMMAEGWCKPNGWRAQQYYQSKLLDINTLPETTFHGKVSQIQSGMVTVLDEKQAKSYMMIVHDSPAISSIRVQGKGSPEALQVGEFIRFVGAVDATGTVKTPLIKVEMITGGVSEPIIANRQQNLAGKILRIEGNKLTLLSATEKPRRLAVELAPNLEINVNLRDLTRVSVGDAVTGDGRIYRAAEGPSFFFAEDLQINLANALHAKSAQPVQQTAAK